MLSYSKLIIMLLLLNLIQETSSNEVICGFISRTVNICETIHIVEVWTSIVNLSLCRLNKNCENAKLYP
ncbi:unnamed protein product [Caenorhabditis angaria]|uniref:Uncharacterized protein n=1 Tax=Caenorhabditis angaria TaxID=860376 RepID=A0A9P1IEJ1_9PELO|nr:unnamed protein product [Caenorhabditis angaria]